MCIRNCPVVVCTAALSSLRVEGMASGSIYTIEKLETDPRKEYGPHIFTGVNYAYFVFFKMATDPCFTGFEKWTSVAPKSKQSWGPDQFLDSTSARVIITRCILQSFSPLFVRSVIHYYSCKRLKHYAVRTTFSAGTYATFLSSMGL